MKDWKKLLCMGLGLALSLSLAACSGGGADATPTPAASTGEGTPAPVGGTPFTTVEEGKLIMSTNAAFPPYEMIDSGGAIVGIDAEIAQAIAEKLELELQIVNSGFDASLLAVQQGKSDMVMAGVSVTKDRLKVMDFSDTYATGVQVIIVKEGSDVTLETLGEYMIGCQMGTTGYILCSDTPENGGFGEDHVIPFEDGSAAVQALANGQVDAVVIDNAPAQEYVKSAPGLKILDTEFLHEDYAIGVDKGNTALLDAVNGALKELIAEGTVQSIIDKYITVS